MDGEIFENAPRVDVDLFDTDERRCAFKNARIRVNIALGSMVLTKHNRWFLPKCLGQIEKLRGLSVSTSGKGKGVGYSGIGVQPKVRQEHVLSLHVFFIRNWFIRN